MHLAFSQAIPSPETISLLLFRATPLEESLLDYVLEPYYYAPHDGYQIYYED